MKMRGDQQRIERERERKREWRLWHSIVRPCRDSSLLLDLIEEKVFSSFCVSSDMLPTSSVRQVVTSPLFPPHIPQVKTCLACSMFMCLLLRTSETVGGAPRHNTYNIRMTLLDSPISLRPPTAYFNHRGPHVYSFPTEESGSTCTPYTSRHYWLTHISLYIVTASIFFRSPMY